MEISKELLCKVFGQEIRFIKYVANNTYEVHFEKPTRLKYIIINIYELAHECKVWAYNKGFFIGSNCRKGITITIIETHQTLNYFEVDFEDFIEFEIKACQWILDNKETK